MRKALILPAVSVAGGILGLVVRQFYLSQAFEPGTGLPISGQPAAYGLWAVAILTAGAIAALSWGKHRTFEGCYTSAFASDHLFQRAACLAGAVLFLIGGVLNIESYVSAPILNPETGAKAVSIVRPVLGVVCLAAAAGIWFVMQKMAAGKPVQSVWPQLPGFACCLWVMANYQGWAQDPVIERYLFSLIAVMLALLSCLLLAGFAYGKGQVTATLITCLLGGSFGIMVLGDGLLLGDLAIHLAMVFYLLSMASALLASDAKPEPPEGLPACGGSCQGCPGCGPIPAPEAKE